MTGTMSKHGFKVGDQVRMKDRRANPHGVCVVMHVTCEENQRAYTVQGSAGVLWLCHEDVLELALRPEWDKEAI
jgi:hypothetical protein